MATKALYVTTIQERQLLALRPLMETATFPDVRPDRILTWLDLAHEEIDLSRIFVPNPVEHQVVRDALEAAGFCIWTDDGNKIEYTRVSEAMSLYYKAQDAALHNERPPKIEVPRSDEWEKVLEEVEDRIDSKWMWGSDYDWEDD